MLGRWYIKVRSANEYHEVNREPDPEIQKSRTFRASFKNFRAGFVKQEVVTIETRVTTPEVEVEGGASTLDRVRGVLRKWSWKSS